MDREDGGGLRCDRRFYLGRVKIECIGIDVHEDRLDTVPQKRMRRGNKAVGRRNHFARYAHGLKRRNQARECHWQTGKYAPRRR